VSLKRNTSVSRFMVENDCRHVAMKQPVKTDSFIGRLLMKWSDLLRD